MPIFWKWCVQAFMVVGMGELSLYSCRIKYIEVCMMGVRVVLILGLWKEPQDGRTYI